MTDSRSSDTARVWVAADKRVHQESERPPLSVYTMLLVEVYDVAELRAMSLPDPCFTVRHLTVWLSRHVEWLTRQDNIADFTDVLKTLNRQLKPVTGDPAPRRVGACPNIIDQGSVTVECGHPLYVPTDGDTITCWVCKREWLRSEWLRLGDLLESA